MSTAKPVAPEMLLPPCTLSFPNLFVPKLAPGGKAPKFSMTGIWTPGDVPKFDAVKQECAKLLLAKYGAPWLEAVKAGQLFWPFKPIAGLLVKPGYPEGGVLINFNANEDSPPHLFDRYRDVNTGKARVITDPKVFYAGCQVIVLARPYLFDVTTKKGVTLGLQAVQFWTDGPRLDGQTNPIEKFAAEDAPAAEMPMAQTEESLSALLGGTGGVSLP